MSKKKSVGKKDFETADNAEEVVLPDNVFINPTTEEFVAETEELPATIEIKQESEHEPEAISEKETANARPLRICAVCGKTANMRVNSFDVCSVVCARRLIQKI